MLDEGFSVAVQERRTEWMLTISAFFDESGKFKDNQIVSFGGVISPAQHYGGQFASDWARSLYTIGLENLTMKDALNWRHPFGRKNPALGVQERIAALMPFVECVRRNLMVISAIAIDVPAFGRMPQKYHDVMGNDPNFTAFTRTLLAALELMHPEDKISLICDDEEEMALPMYKMYRRVKKIYPDAHQQLRAITFADDRWSYGLQAADMVVSLMRLEAGFRFFRVEYEYQELFSALTNTTPKAGDAFWLISLGFCDDSQLKRLGENWFEQKPKTLSLTKKAFEGADGEIGIRSVRQDSTRTSEGEPSEAEGNSGEGKGGEKAEEI